MDEVNGVMNVPKETIVPMDDCDHGDICRFSDPTNSGFRKVCSHLEKLGNGQSIKVLFYLALYFSSIDVISLTNLVFSFYKRL